jgi:Tfp pilus assembly protein PilX
VTRFTPMTTSQITRSDERGVALVIVLFLTMIVSAIAAGMAYTARTETLSSQSYTTMTHARYGAESGLAAATNYLLSTPYALVAPGTATDPLTNYNTGFAPVRRVTGAVVSDCSPAASQVTCLSSGAGGSNYPVGAVVTAFGTAASGTLAVGNGTVTYGARATLLAIRRVTDSMSGNTETLTKWEITGWGRRGGSGSAEVEVSAIVERQIIPTYRYAAFATNTGCSSLSFSGGARTRSYNSQTLVSGNPVPADTDGDVGTNGNLALSGTPTTVNGTLSTPRTGVGSCTANNVTALTISGQATVNEGLIELPQVVPYPTPPTPSPLPPTTSVNMSNSFSCVGYPGCVKSGSTVTLTADPTNTVPYSAMGNVSVGPADLVLNAGTYIFNSLSINGNAHITTNGKVIIKLAGQGTTNVLSLTGNSITNSSYNPSNLQIIYGGTGNISLTGGTATAAILYAPNANVTLSGNGNVYGSMVAGRMSVTGGGEIFYDTNLAATAISAGLPVMSGFNWRTF